MLKHKLVDFIIQFMEEVDKEISEMKLFVCNTNPHIRCVFDVSKRMSWLTLLEAERTGEIRSRVILDSGLHSHLIVVDCADHELSLISDPWQHLC